MNVLKNDENHPYLYCWIGTKTSPLARGGNSDAGVVGFWIGIFQLVLRMQTKLNTCVLRKRASVWE